MASFLRVGGGAIVASLVALAAPAVAAPTVDGTRDADYGAVKSNVTYVPGAPTSNFGSPTPFSNNTSYAISLVGGQSSVFGFFQAAADGALPGDAPLPFANLYFGRPEGGFSLGFEIGRNGVNAFIPANGTKVTLDSSLYQTAFSSDNRVIEFSLANSLFTGPIAGLTYTASAFPAADGNIRLNLSQSFGYSVAGGTTYGDNRLGVVALGGGTGAVPEPATWAMLMLGFGGMGYAMRRRRKDTARVRFA